MAVGGAISRNRPGLSLGPWAAQRTQRTTTSANNDCEPRDEAKAAKTLETARRKREQAQAKEAKAREKKESK